MTFQELQMCEMAVMVSYSHAIAQDILAVVPLLYIFSFPVFRSGSLKKTVSFPPLKAAIHLHACPLCCSEFFLLSCGLGKSITFLPSRVRVCAHDAKGILFPSSALISVNVMKTIPGISLSLTSPRAAAGSLCRSGRCPAGAQLGSGQGPLLAFKC